MRKEQAEDMMKLTWKKEKDAEIMRRLQREQEKEEARKRLE